jgi:hypothetical protein
MDSWLAGEAGARACASTATGRRRRDQPQKEGGFACSAAQVASSGRGTRSQKEPTPALWIVMLPFCSREPAPSTSSLEAPDLPEHIWGFVLPFILLCYWYINSTLTDILKKILFLYFLRRQTNSTLTEVLSKILIFIMLNKYSYKLIWNLFYSKDVWKYRYWYYFI